MIANLQQLVIGSSLENLNLVSGMVEEICDQYNINNTYFGNILVAVTEACSNAIVHGNQGKPDKKVNIQFESGPHGLKFSVRDEGSGFDYHAVPDPTESSDEEAPASRKGLYLIRTLSDEVVFKENGSLIQFGFHISSINYQLSVERSRMLHSFYHPEEKKTEKSRE
ncbi:MAG: ATP-binding protein [Bacteroidota bacterium]